ncbi:hypothetical protein GC584_06395 [Corynebacterium sp. zg912]|uniref:Uncharacterized protein n=1 Tax=Corynebacterium wankanglinii TaxID=2735136 RepID=A0A7V9A242_9CORY|nr:MULTISPECIES: hypothetical protein [Corynebacterium]MBA1835181.1 hypothetical protein [Corynebacterium wankanglinii]MBA1837846.1 hypothetical protein [Corynebacterium wankanglinii]MCR5929049.1 hypothetical protein [Corynebacterium sp. zg912]
MTTPQNPRRAERTTRRPVTSSTAVRAETVADDDQHIGQEAWIGTDSTEVSNGNVSWGAIFAGVVTFLAIMILLGVGAAAMGLQGSGGLATGIFALISLAIAFAAAGYVSGALGVRAGLFHGLGTWATSLIASLILAGWLGSSIIGGLGSVLGDVTGTLAETAGNAANVTREDAQDASNTVQDNVTQDDLNNAENQARDAANDAANQARDAYNEYSDDAAEGTWWTFAGLLLGAVISAFAGTAGARSVLNRDEKQVVTTRR